MPNGIIIVRWDDKLGVVVEGLYPKTLKISEDHIMRIFTTHAMGGGEAGFLSMSIETLNIASYYTGLPEEGRSQFYVALLLKDDENADIFEEPLIEVSKLLIDHVKDKYFAQFLAKQYDDILKLTEMTEEQRYSMIHRDPRRILVLRKLGLGVLPKDELRKWISDQLGEEVLDLDAILAPFFKTQMIHELPIETMDGRMNCVFLIKDVFSMRSPVEKFYKMSKDGGAELDMKKVFKTYKDMIDEFFKDYKLGDADSKQIADLIADPNNYNLVTILRNNYIEINQLPDIYEKSLDQIMPEFNELKRHNIVADIKDKKGNTWIFLKSDVVFPTFFPEYIVDSIRRRWMEKGITQNLALKHLELLKSVYRGEVEKLELPIGVPKKEVPVTQLPTKKRKREIVPAVPVTKTMGDDELFKLVERVNILRREAKMDLDNKDREKAHKKLQEAIKITKDLMASGAVGQEKRLDKLERVANSVAKLIDKEKAKKPVTPPPAIAPAPSVPAASASSAADKQKILRQERDNAIANADKALTAGNFNEAVSYLENAAALSKTMGEKDKAAEITKMASDIKSKLEKLGV